MKIIDKNHPHLLNKKNVVAVALGQKWTDGQNTGEDALLVFVSKKEDPGKLTRHDLIPDKIDGMKTDVVGRTGEITAMALTDRVRPIYGGASCGHYKVTAGTMGGWFVDKDGEIVGLSNNHVLAWENLAKSLESHGDGPGGGHVTFQPGIYDDSDFRSNKVGRLKSFVRMIRRGNVQDSAIFKPYQYNLVESDLHTIGQPVGFNDAIKVGDDVQKSGRTTGYTTGKVIATDAVVRVQYSRRLGVLEFRDQIITSAMSAGGDSGSLLMDMNNNVAGLLFAGSPQVTIHNKIKYPRETYGLKVYNPDPLQESFSYTLTVDGVSQQSSNLNEYRDLLIKARRLAKEGKKVSFSVNYSV